MNYLRLLRKAKQTIKSSCSSCKTEFSQPFVAKCDRCKDNYETALEKEMLRLFCEEEKINIKKGESLKRFMKEVME